MKATFIEEFGYRIWSNSHKLTAYTERSARLANKSWNENIHTTILDTTEEQAADNFLIDKAIEAIRLNSDTKVYIVSNDRLLVSRVNAVVPRDIVQFYYQGNEVENVERIKLIRSSNG